MGLVGKAASHVPEGQWAGHVVVIVPTRDTSKFFMLDPTITQVNHPEHEIDVPPLVLRTSAKFVSGESDSPIWPNGSLLIYKAYPHDKSFNQHGDCLESEGLDEASKIVVSRIQI